MVKKNDPWIEASDAISFDIMFSSFTEKLSKPLW